MRKVSRKILLIIAILIGLPLVVTFVLYLAAPIYRFDEPEPFKGEYWNNPYEGMNASDWKMCNFQAHTRAWGGLTNGRKNTDTVMDSVYRYLGFDHVSVSNYMKINKFGNGNPDYIPTYEHGFGLFKTHHVCIGARNVWPIDYLFSQNLSIKQHKIHKLQKNSRLVVVAHPVFFGGYKVREMKYLSDYRVIEALNPYGNSLEHWDMALSNGHRVYVMGNDDCHDANNPNLLGKRFTMINTAEVNTENVCSALEKGNAYAVDFEYVHDERMQDKRERLKDVPKLLRAELVADTFFVETSQKTDKVIFIGQNGKELKVSDNLQDNYYKLSENDTYLRTELYFPNGTVLYLNPLTRHHDSSMKERTHAHVDYLRTWMMRVVYVLILLFSVYTISKSNAEKKRRAGTH